MPSSRSARLAFALSLLLSGPLLAEGLVDLRREIARTLAQVNDPRAFNAATAAPLLRARFDELLRLAPERIDQRALAEDPHGAVIALFELTLALDRRMAELHQAGQLTNDVADAKRRALRGIRFLREQVLLLAAARTPEKLYQHGRPRLAEVYPRHHWSVAPGWERTSPVDPDFPRTFMILCVGGSSVSAGIARSAAEDNMFSHFALGYRSDREQVVQGKTWPAGSLFVIEALIETGVVLNPLEKHYASTVRDVIFVVRDRSKQAALDAAADAFFERARQALNAGEALPYDFSMGSRTGLSERLEGKGPTGAAPMGDLPAYFCSGVGAVIGDAAGVQVFTNLSRLEQGEQSRRLFEAWGIDPGKRVPAPGDADVSGTLLRVAEGCVISELEKAHVMHVTLAEMFRWMDEEGWQLRMPALAHAFSGLLGRLNDGPLDLGLIPRGIDGDILRTMGPMDRAAGHLSNRLLEENAAFRAAHGRSMTPPEMAVRLREVRDDVDGLRRWFRPAPRALGTWALRLDSGRTARLEVAHDHGLRYRVSRVELDREGNVVSTREGTATQRDGDLDVRWNAVWRVRYWISADGSIQSVDGEEVGRRLP